MAFLLNKATTFSRFQSSSQKTNDQFLQQSRRRFHIEPGAREKAISRKPLSPWHMFPDFTVSLSGNAQMLLEEDPALKRFKSHKKSVYRLKRVGDVLTIVVVAGCCYEIYVRAVMREEARKQAKTTTEGA